MKGVIAVTVLLNLSVLLRVNESGVLPHPMGRVWDASGAYKDGFLAHDVSIWNHI